MMLQAFARHEDEIAGMVDERFYPMEWVRRSVVTGVIQTLYNERAIVGFEFRSYPGGAKELHGMFAAGPLEDVLLLIDETERLAREMGMDVFTIASRAGWTRILKGRGFEPFQTVIVKELV